MPSFPPALFFFLPTHSTTATTPLLLILITNNILTMGGSAFSSLPEPPYTPRMPHEIYRRVLSSCSAALRELFVCVAAPIEGPGKKDHGDIDLLVALERRVVFPTPQDDSVPRTPHELMAAVEHILCAKYAIVHPTGSSANLAIPWPLDAGQHDMALHEAPGTEKAATAHGESQEKYIQVDIRICPSVDQLCWVRFMHPKQAHGLRFIGKFPNCEGYVVAHGLGLANQPEYWRYARPIIEDVKPIIDGDIYTWEEK